MTKNPKMDSAAHRWVIAVVAGAVMAAALLLVPWSPGSEPLPTASWEEAPAAASQAPEAVTEIVTAEEMQASERERVEPTNPPPAPQLERAAVKGELRGRVLLETRAPANGARVRIGAGEVQMEPDGSFVVPRDQVARGDDLVATLEGYEPAVIDDLSQTAEFRSDDVLDVVLPGRALAIDGWLVETGGAPCEGWKLELYRGTDCGLVSFPNLLAEDLAAGGSAQKQDPRMVPAGPEKVVNPNLQTIGKDGAFRVAGLRRGHDYVLRAWHERALRTVISGPIPAGATRYVFTVPDAERRERVWGRVVDRRGVPIADVRVRLTMRVHEVEGRTSYQTGAQERTGPDGSFELKDVPRENLLLRFDGKGVDSYYHDLPATDPGADLRIELACMCRFRYEALPGVAAAVSLRVIDANEKPMRITRQLGQGSSESNTSYAIENGRSPDLMVSDTAAWLLLQTRDGVQRRVPMPLSRGDITIVRG